MPNKNHNLEPRYDGPIDEDVVDVETSGVDDYGYAGVESKYGGHLVAWAPFEDGGQIKTTSYNQNKKKRTQSYVQQDGAVNIGTEEWVGERLVILILDQKIEE
ncbi:hypothetical protein [Halobacterium salinarum]|uniref:hypothetical protein n=1 Tax=Halobacterium salinarum TaxID=2242 RepID=UPI00255312E0|nr:hypothetical protein [Halobacterium salinarum]MDL0121771.1 hypothetical protein [Halobacterium salinarum]